MEQRGSSGQKSGAAPSNAKNAAIERLQKPQAPSREILFDLDAAQLGIVDKLGKTPELDLLAKTHANLLRMWIED